MIEINYHTSDETGGNAVVKPPKNIRQIGSPRGRHKIYVEDYVHTYLHSTLLFGEDQQRAAILLGRSEVSQDIRYTFIEGAINCEDFIFQKDGIIFDESCWEYIYQEMKQYFDKQIIVGWFLGRPGFPLKISHTVEAAQRKYFSGRDKVLYLWDPTEGEDAFFAYEQGAFQKKEGYYVYYEKNLAMQEYMVCQRERTRQEQGGIQEMMEGFPETEEIAASGSGEEIKEMESMAEQTMESEGDILDSEEEKAESGETSAEEIKWSMSSEKKTVSRTNRSADAAIGNYRNRMKKRQRNQSVGGKNLFLYGAATVALIAICISGVVNLNSYQKMKQMEEVLMMISKPLEEQQAEKEQMQDQSGQRQITVQTVPGEVKPQDGSSPEEGAADGQGAPEQPDSQEAAGQSTEGSPTGQSTDGQSPEGQETAGQPQSGEAQEPENSQPEGTDQPQDDGSAQEAMAQSYREQGYYVVQPGDRLESICRQLYPGEDMMEQICELNQIEDVDKILVGQKLILP